MYNNIEDGNFTYEAFRRYSYLFVEQYPDSTLWLRISGFARKVNPRQAGLEIQQLRATTFAPCAKARE